MKRIGSHPNIVSMVGACTMVEPICLVMEYVPYGNLQNFLKWVFETKYCFNFRQHVDTNDTWDHGLRVVYIWK